MNWQVPTGTQATTQEPQTIALYIANLSTQSFLIYKTVSFIASIRIGIGKHIRHIV